LFLTVWFTEQLVAFGNDGSGLPGREFIRPDIVSKFFRIGCSDGRIFIVAMCLAGDDLPIVVALKPCVGDVIPRFQVLAEDRLGLVRVITQYCCVPNDPALGVPTLERSGISRW